MEAGRGRRRAQLPPGTDGPTINIEAAGTPVRWRNPAQKNAKRSVRVATWLELEREVRRGGGVCGCGGSVRLAPSDREHEDDQSFLHSDSRWERAKPHSIHRAA